MISSMTNTYFLVTLFSQLKNAETLIILNLL